jgi:hypothetical protein
MLTYSVRGCRGSSGDMYSHGVCMNKGDLAYSAVGDCKRNPIRNILKWVPVVREVGYARSSADGKDNITFPERRGISSEMISTAGVHSH